MILDLGEERRCSHRHSITIKDRDNIVFANKRAFRVVWQQEATGTLRHFAAASVGPAQSATMPPGRAFLVGVIVPVINSRNSAEASADMIQHLRADLQSDMQPSHASSSSPSRPEPSGLSCFARLFSISIASSVARSDPVACCFGNTFGQLNP
jgi:hypothetical protein